MANKYTGSNTGQSGLEVTEVDGTPDVFGVTKITVSNGDLTNDGNGAVTIDTSGGGGGTPGGSDTQIQYNDGGSAFGGIADFTWDDTDLKIGGSTPATKLKFRDDGLYIDGATNGVLALTSDSSIDLNIGAAGVVVKGTTPKVTIGDGGAEDTMLLFDGNAIDFHLALDDTDDSLIIGTGTAAGTNDMVSFIGDGINADTIVKIANSSDDYHIAVDYSASTLVLGNGATVSTNAFGSAINIDGSDNVRIPLSKVTAKTGDVSISGGANADYLGQVLTFNGTDLTLTIGDSGATLPVGAQVVAFNMNASALTIAAGSGTTLAGTTSVAQNKAVTIIQILANGWACIG